MERERLEKKRERVKEMERWCGRETEAKKVIHLYHWSGTWMVTEIMPALPAET